MRNLAAAALVVLAVAAGSARQNALPPGHVAAVSGLDTAGFDTRVRAQDDLFAYVNGRWLAATPVPPDRVTYGTFVELAERAERDLHAIIQELAAQPARRSGGPAQQIADLYTSMTDVRRIEELGAGPMAAELKRIEDIRSTSDVAEVAGHLSSIAAGGPFSASVGTDPRDPRRISVEITQGGTLLGSRDYYLRSDAPYTGIRAEYSAYLARIFNLVERPRADDDARAVIALETEIARGLRADGDGGPDEEPERFTFPQLHRELPGFDWYAWGRPQGITRTGSVVLVQPSFFKRFARLVASTPLDSWKAWLAARYITAIAPYVSDAFGDARFDFFGRVLTGQEAPIGRPKRGVAIVNAYLGDAIGRLYVEKHFPAASKVRVEEIVAHLREAFRETLEESTWLSKGGRREALAKLAKLTTRVGYPEDWRSFKGLEIRPDDLVGNVRRAQQFDHAWRLARLRGFGPKDAWFMSPQTVNAYYNPARNEVVIPAAMLQPPVFTPGADDAVNFGAIGAVVGHEIVHAFDTNGRRVDARGISRDWWTEADEQAFARQALPLVRQFNAYAPLPGLRINGELTFGENVADLGGLAVAYRAYRSSLDGRAPAVIDGLTGDQRFFLGWAQVWRGKEREEFLRQSIHTNRHAPSRYRANAPLSNFTPFYEAFGVRPGDRLYREPTQRVGIW